MGTELRAAWLFALIMPATGCGNREPLELPCPAHGCVQRAISDRFAAFRLLDLDLLFVVDDTPSIKSSLPTLASAFQTMARQLEAWRPGGLPPIHVAFVPASVAADAARTCVPSPGRARDCDVTGPNQFLATLSCGADPNFSRPFTDTFSCMADLGSDACGALEPLEAMRLALGVNASKQGLAGFLRPDTPLMVVLISGQDDSSVRAGASVPVPEFVAFLKSLKADPGKILVAAVGPPTDCPDAGAAPPRAPRLKAFVDAFGSTGVFGPLCGTPSQVVFSRLFEEISRHIGDLCVAGVRDMDPTEPGVQADCVVKDQSGQADQPLPAPMSLPSCDGAGPPCWRLAPADSSCPIGHLVLSIDRGGNWCAQNAFDMGVTCLGCAESDDPACAGH
jgi:hypothetical protein